LLHAPAFALLFTTAVPLSRGQDAPPVDVAQTLQLLKQLKDQQNEQVRGAKQRALQSVQAAAASAASAAAAWEEAVREVQFAGAAREGAQFREWKEKDGAGLSGKEAQNAARCYFLWLGLTLQRSAGVTNRDLLPQVIAYTKEANAQQQMMEALDESLKQDKELADRNNKNRAERKEAGEKVKKIAQEIFTKGLGGSPPVQALRLGEWVNVQNWEASPGNVDGIYQTVVLPELRAAKDPRILEFWDMKIRREAEAITRSSPAFEIEKFNQVRRPELIWSRAQDMVLVGQRNRGISEMLAVIKANPAHPQTEPGLPPLKHC
jgi:hypothetical protein